MPTQLEPQEFQYETVTIDRDGCILERQQLVGKRFVEDLGSSIAFELVYIPSQAFQMGSLKGRSYPDESPQHLVILKPFWIGRSLVTQQQWQAIMGSLPPCRFRSPENPVENVSWVHAARFCERLTKKTGRAYHLPSEAQWECACRAGSQGDFSFGPTLTSDLANYNAEFKYLEEPAGVYRHTTTPSGSFPANAYGLYDLHGNLWEWCSDAWHDDYTGAPPDGSAWESGDRHPDRVARGGSWHDTPQVCRSASRLRANPAYGDEMTGFRVVLE